MSGVTFGAENGEERGAGDGQGDGALAPSGFTLVGGGGPVCVDGVCELPAPDTARVSADAGPTV